jgi:hypothetical protein
MPRLGLALILFACVSHGAATIGGNARAEDAELMRCLDASTILGAGGDVSDQELKAAQGACTRLKQSPPDKDTLARVKAAAENIDEEVARRGASAR